MPLQMDKKLDQTGGVSKLHAPNSQCYYARVQVEICAPKRAIVLRCRNRIIRANKTEVSKLLRIAPIRKINTLFVTKISAVREGHPEGHPLKEMLDQS